MVQYRTHRNALSEERQRWMRERNAQISDRRLDTVRHGYLSLMAAAGGLAAVMDRTQVAFAGEHYALEWYEALKVGLRESGGVVDALGSDEARMALVATRQRVADSHHADDALEQAERVLNSPVGYDHSVYEQRRFDASNELNSSSEDWRGTLIRLLDAMRQDRQRFEAASS
jgi:hypothetical protein